MIKLLTLFSLGILAGNYIANVNKKKDKPINKLEPPINKKDLYIIIDAENVSHMHMISALTQAQNKFETIKAVIIGRINLIESKKLQKIIQEFKLEVGKRYGEDISPNKSDFAITIAVTRSLERDQIKNYCILSNDKGFATIEKRILNSESKLVKYDFKENLILHYNGKTAPLKKLTSKKELIGKPLSSKILEIVLEEMQAESLPITLKNVSKSLKALKITHTHNLKGIIQSSQKYNFHTKIIK